MIEQKTGEGYHAPGGVGFQVGGHRGVVALGKEHLVVGYGDYSGIEVYVLPHEAEYLTATHTGGQGEETEGVRPRAGHCREKLTRLLVREGHLLLRIFPRGAVIAAHGGADDQAVVLGAEQDGAKHLDAPRLRAPAEAGQ